MENKFNCFGIKSVLIIAFIVFIQSSCTKDIPTPPAIGSLFTIHGLWEGTYKTNGVAHQPAYASFVFYPDGSMLFKDAIVGSKDLIVVSKGTWALSGTTLTYKDTTINNPSIVVQEGSFDYDSVKNTLTNGTWQNVANSNGSLATGTFPTMKKTK